MLLGVGLYFTSTQTVAAAEANPEQSQQELVNDATPAKQTADKIDQQTQTDQQEGSQVKKDKTQTANSVQEAEQKTNNEQTVEVTTAESNASTNVHLSIIDTDTNKPLPDENKGWADQEYHLGLNGSFEVKLKHLLDHKPIEIAKITTTSSNGNYLNLDRPSQKLTLSDQDKVIGDLRLDYDQNNGLGSLYLVSSRTQSTFSDLLPESNLTISLNQLPTLAILNWKTDPHKLTPVSDQKYYW